MTQKAIPITTYPMSPHLDGWGATRKQRKAKRLRAKGKKGRRLPSFDSYRAYLQSPIWKKKRARVLRRAEGICELCKDREATQVHHLVYRSRGGKHDAKNGVWVCNKCQQDIHAKLVIVAWVGSNPARTVRFQRLTDWRASSRALSTPTVGAYWGWWPGAQAGR